MKPALRAQILAFNKKRAEESKKASDMDIMVAAILKLPPGQLKKLLSDDVLAVLAKYGYKEESE